MANFDKIIKDIKAGIPLVVVDEYTRENEGDVVIAAEKATRDNLVFTLNHAGGLMCVPCSGKILDRLQVPIMTSNSNDPLETPFTVSVDAITVGTGMPVEDRLKTISTMADENSTVADLRFPGHLFPLRARDGLLKDRRGHTEASIELMRLAGMKDIAVICEIMNNDGTMTRGEQLTNFAKVYRLNIISVEEIYEHVHNESI